MNENKQKTDLVKAEAISVAKIVTGCFIYALSVVLFLDPAQIIPGSVTGIGVVVKAVSGMPIGRLNLIINIPLVIIGTIILGKRLLIYTGLTVFLTSVMMDGLAFLQPFTQDVLLASVFGGVVMGIGLGLILDGGGSTGGTTIVGRLVSKKLPHLPMGTILLVGDFIIITAGTFVLKDWDLFLYSVIDLYICVIAIDKVMYGYKINSLSVVWTSRPEELESAIRAEKPCRVLHAGDGRLEILTRKKDMSRLQHHALRLDPDASCGTWQTDMIFGELYKEAK